MKTLYEQITHEDGRVEYKPVEVQDAEAASVEDMIREIIKRCTERDTLESDWKFPAQLWGEPK
jgi:hypothetical protein